MPPGLRQRNLKIMRLTFKTKTSFSKACSNSAGLEAGAVLLEVVLALALFVTAATIITSGLNASLNGVERLRANTHAANLAVTVLSELQLGIKPATQSDPQPFEPPFADWTWEILVAPETNSEEAGPFKRIEVVVRRLDPPAAHSLFQVVAPGDSRADSPGEPTLGVSP
jgi:type II secretory pathway pseudopilin PulG